MVEKTEPGNQQSSVSLFQSDFLLYNSRVCIVQGRFSQISDFTAAVLSHGSGELQKRGMLSRCHVVIAAPKMAATLINTR